MLMESKDSSTGKKGPRLLDRLHDAIRTHHCSARTEGACARGVKRTSTSTTDLKGYELGRVSRSSSPRPLFTAGWTVRCSAMSGGTRERFFEQLASLSLHETAAIIERSCRIIRPG